jgi:biotin carboxylase
MSGKPGQQAPAATAVVVDAYASGRLLTDSFARLGLGTVHVQSSEQLMPSLMAPAVESYRDNVVCATDDDVDAAVAALAAHRPVAVVAGAEPGVRLADILSERLGLAGNGTALSPARRNKFVMIETLRAAGIRCAGQHAAARPADAAAWADAQGFPVVVKPLSSSSTDHVFICQTAGDVIYAAQQVLASRTLFEEPNSQVLVQSWLDGTEYAVDTVSAHGQRYVCGVWEYHKHTTGAGRRIYDRNLLRDPDSHPVPEVIAYVDTVLHALGIRYGAAHAEVIMTAAGPALVEIAARLNGGMHPAFHDYCLGGNQADLTALAYARTERFLELYGGRVYRKRCEAIVLHTSTTRDGLVEAIDQTAVDGISALPTVRDLTVKLAPGRRIRPTVDLLTSPVRVYLAHQDLSRLIADCNTIEGLKDLVYQVSRTCEH